MSEPLPSRTGPLARVWREPLLHFVVLGAMAFVAYQMFGPSPTDGPIEVRAHTVTSLEAGLTQSLGRPPTRAELELAVEEFVSRELLVREARHLGLDVDDPIVRRRLVQKMQMVHESMDPAELPSDEELRAFSQAHAERYANAARVSFEHRYWSAARHEDPRAEALEVLATAGSSASDGATVPPEVGDPFAHGQRMRSKDQDSLASMFGAAFAKTTFGLEPGRWHVVESTYGIHLVRLEAAPSVSAPPFESIRNRVLADVLAERQQAARDEALARLRADHEVVVHWPQ